MPQILIRHKVKDYDAWKLVFDDHATTRSSYGFQGGRLFRNADDPTEVLMLGEFDALDRAREFIASDDLRTTMGEAGVSDQPDVYYLDHEETVDA